MIRLQSFAGAVVIGVDGLAASRAASQRRTVGLLSVLAVAGKAGLSRDKVVGILWPEVSHRRARHSLTQAMYAARKALDCEDLFHVSEDIRLNPDRISSDVAEFQAALARGDDLAAAQLYRGPFLDGFYLASPEFERWVSLTRDRLESEAVAALERLVRQMEEGEDLKGAAEWLRRIASLRPSDASVTIRLMQTLATTGDRARAIEQAELHGRIMRDEYELEPDPQVAQLAEALRTPQVPHAPLAVSFSADVDPAAIPAEIELMQNGPAEPDQPEFTRGLPARVDELRYDRLLAERAVRSPVHRRTWLKRAAGAIVLALVVLFAANLVRRDPVPMLGQSIVVAPFRVHDADASLSYLREGLVDLLSTRLANDESARGVDAGAVLRAWRRAGITRESHASRDTMMKLAATFGAERLIIGSVVGGAERAVLSASVVQVGTGEVSGEAVVEGPIDSLVALADRLAGKLLLSQAGQDGRLAGQTTHSLPALRSYLSGLQAYARGDHAVAAEHYARALRTDSSFALAALRMAFAAERLNDFELQRRALDIAWRYRDGMSERDRAHLMAMTGAMFPAASTRAETMAAWEEAAQLGSNAAEVWFGFAKTIIDSGAAHEREAERERAAAALQRTLDLDPYHGAARLLLAQLQGDSAATRLFAPDPAAADSLQPLAPFLRWRLAALRADDSLSAQISNSLGHYGPANLRAIAATSQFDAVRLEDGVRAINILLERALSYDQAFDLLLAQHGMAVNRGRPSEALQASARLQRLSPATRAHLRLRVLDAVFAEGDTVAALKSASELSQSLLRARLPSSASSDACALAQWQIATSDTAGARGSLDFLRNTTAELAPVSTPAPICTKLIEAGLAVATGSPGARTLVASLDSLVLTTAAAGDAAVYGHIAIARLHSRLGDGQRALAAIRRRPYMSAAWPRYLATALREEGELALALQDSVAARTAFQFWLDLRNDPEPALLSQKEAVRSLVTDTL